MSAPVSMMTLDLDDCLPLVLLSERFSWSCFTKSSYHAFIMMLKIHCFLSSYFTTNRNILKEKMISIIEEIPCSSFFRFLCIKFFSYIWDMGFFLLPLVLSKFRTISFIMPKIITSKASCFVHISSLILRTKFTESSFLPGHGGKGLIPYTWSWFQPWFLYLT